MAERKRYVNTASSAGGDGTTNATSGANRAYASMSECESVERTAQANLVTSGDYLHVLFSGTAADTTSMTWTSGWTTDATHNIILEGDALNVAAGWDTSKYRLSVSNAGCLITQVTYIQFWYLQVEVQDSGTSPSRTALVLNTIGASGGLQLFQNLRVRQNPSSTGTSSLVGFQCNSANSKMVLANCYIENFRQGTNRGFTMSAGTAYIYDCGVYNCTTGIRTFSGGTTVVKNTWAQGCTAGFTLASGTWGTGTTNNASDIAADAPGTSPSTGTISFVSVGTDFHLVVGDTIAKGLAADLSADAIYAFSDDVDQVARVAPWDIGPDQYVAAAGSTFPPVPAPMNPYSTILTM